MTSSHPETRQSLILRLRNAGDLAAWQQFQSLYSPVVYRVARRSGLQEADAVELLQEVMWAVARAVGRFEPHGPARFRTWLDRIVRRKLVDGLRRRSRQITGGGNTELLELLQQQADPSAGLSGVIEAEYRHERLRRAAAIVRQQATATTWEAFWLSSVQGVPVPETARRLGLTVGAVYIARSRVIAKLRALVEEQE